MDIMIVRTGVTLLVSVVIGISIWSWFAWRRNWNAPMAARASILMGVGSAMSLITNHQDGVWFWIAAVIGVPSLVAASVLLVLMRSARKPKWTKHYFAGGCWHPMVLDPMGDRAPEFGRQWLAEQDAERDELIASGESVAR